MQAEGGSGWAARASESGPVPILWYQGYKHVGNTKLVSCTASDVFVDISTREIIINFLILDYNIVLRVCSMLYEDFVKEFKGSGLKFEQVPFNHPMFIMYSSGTTGTPKCMVHSVGVRGLRDVFEC